MANNPILKQRNADLQRMHNLLQEEVNDLKSKINKLHVKYSEITSIQIAQAKPIPSLSVISKDTELERSQNFIVEYIFGKEKR